LCFYVHNRLGGGQLEKYYQRALSESLKEKGVDFKEQVYCPIFFKEKVVGKNFIDFLVDNKVAVEIKSGTRYSRKHVLQVFNYLKVSNLQLAILVNFGLEEVSFKRLPNIN
jgi:GxxExxY protein